MRLGEHVVERRRAEEVERGGGRRAGEWRLEPLRVGRRQDLGQPRGARDPLGAQRPQRVEDQLGVRLQVARQAARGDHIRRERLAPEGEPDPVPGGERLHPQDFEQPQRVVGARLQPRHVRERAAPHAAQELQGAHDTPAAAEVERHRRLQPVRLAADAQGRQRAL